MKPTIGDPELARAVDLLLGGVIPERRAEWEHLKLKYAPQFVFAQHQPGKFVMGKVIGQNVVSFSERTRDIIWILAFVSWKVLLANADALFRQDPPYGPASFLALPGQAEVDEAVTELMSDVGYIFYLSASKPFTWPDGVPKTAEFLVKVDDTSLTTHHERAAYNLVCMSLAFILLHEVRHLMLEHDQQISSDSREEEYECDRFALEYLTKQSATYAASHHYSDLDVLRKRGMGIMLAMFYLLAVRNSSEWTQLGINHPPVAGRLKVLTRELDLPDDDQLWVFLGSLMIGLLRHQGGLMPSVNAATAKALCYQLMDCYA